jgi:hypothetical protein
MADFSTSFQQLLKVLYSKTCIKEDSCSTVVPSVGSLILFGDNTIKSDNKLFIKMCNFTGSYGFCCSETNSNK